MYSQGAQALALLYQESALMFLSNALRSKKGFTLLELIVVVVVLGILAALAIPSFSTVKQSAADKIAIQSAEGIVRNAKALAAFDGAALSDSYVDQAGAEIGVRYNSSTNTVTISSGGETGAAFIDATTGAVTVAGAGTGSGQMSVIASGSLNYTAAYLPCISYDISFCGKMVLRFNAGLMASLDFSQVQVGDTVTISGLQLKGTDMAETPYTSSELNGDFIVTSKWLDMMGDTIELETPVATSSLLDARLGPNSSFGYFISSAATWVLKR